MNMEIKYNSGNITEVKEFTRNNIPVGLVTGYIATWDIDRGNDKFIQGAFTKSLQRYRELGRPLRMKDHHDRTVGAFPIDSVIEDERGLKGTAEINLDVQQGRELYSLVKQGVISDFSIGYSVSDFGYENNIRLIKESEVWEGSLVDEPMNPHANVLEVKTVNNRSVFPSTFAEPTYKWDSAAAEKRVRAWAGADENPTDKYKKSFLWYDSDNEDLFTAYKLQIVDIVNGSPVVVPRAVFAVRAVLSGARGGVDISEADQEKIKGVVNMLYADMDLDPPFDDDKIKAFNITELCGLPQGDLRRVLQHCELSKNAGVYVAAAVADRVTIDSAGITAEEEKALDTLLNKLKEV